MTQKICNGSVRELKKELTNMGSKEWPTNSPWEWQKISFLLLHQLMLLSLLHVWMRQLNYWLAVHHQLKTICNMEGKAMYNVKIFLWKETQDVLFALEKFLMYLLKVIWKLKTGLEELWTKKAKKFSKVCASNICWATRLQSVNQLKRCWPALEFTSQIVNHF